MKNGAGKTPREQAHESDDVREHRDEKKIPPADQHTPGEEGDDSGGGLRGA